MPGTSKTQKAEAKYNVTTEFPHLGLHSAAATGNIGLVKYALSHGQPINSVLDGVLPLHAACSGGNELVVKLLIDSGADVNAPRLPRKYSAPPRTAHHHLPHHASHPSHPSNIAIGTTGSTPLHFAAANGHTGVALTLLQRGARADRADKHGVTPEMIARQNGWLGCADAIGAWVRERDRDLESRPAGEDYDEEGQSLGTGGLESVGRAQRERHGSFCACDAPDCPGLRSRRLNVKHSIENAISLFKAAGSGHSSSPTPAASVFGDAFPDVPGTPEGVRWERRPSLPHTHEEGSSQSQVWRSPFSSASSRRPSSAGTGASEGGGSVRTTPRKLGSKYSLLNLFKKASGEGESAGGTGSVAASANHNHNTAADGQGASHGQSPPESPRPGIGMGILHRAHGRAGSGSGSVSQPPPRALRFDSSSSASSSGSNSSQPPGVETTGAKPPSSPRDRRREDEEEEEEEEYGQPIPSRMGLGVGEEGSPKPSLRTGGLRSRGQSQTSQLSPLEDPRADPHPEQDSTSADVAPGTAPALLPPPPMMMGPGVLLDGERNHVSPDTYTFTQEYGSPSPSPSPSPPRRPDLSPPSTGASTFEFMGAGDGRLRGDSMSSATLSVGTSASTASGGAPATPAGTLGTVLSGPVVASPGRAAQELDLELFGDDAGEARGSAGKDGEYYDATFVLGLSGAGVGAGAGVGGRRAHAPLDIDIRAISSHAQAEALVARAQQSILELGHMETGGEAGGGGAGLGVRAAAGGADAGQGPGQQQQQQQQQGLPLSARLAAYGESLALERRLKMEMERGKERARERQWEREKERRRGRGKGWGRDMERSTSASASAGAGVVAFGVDADGGAGAVGGVERPYGVKVRSASATMDREAAVAGLGLAGGTGPQWRRQGGEQYQRHGSLEGPRGRGMGAGSSPRGAKGQPPKVRRPHTSGGVPGDEASDSSSPAPRATRHHRSHSAAPSGLYGGAYVGSPGSLDRDEPAREADEADLVDGDASDLSATPVQTRSAQSHASPLQGGSTSPASAPPPVLVSSPSSGAPGKLSTAPAISTTTSTTTTTAAGAAAATAPVPALDNDTLRPTPTARMRSRTPDPKRDYAGYGDLGSGRPAPALGLGVDGADGRGDDAGGGVELFRVFTAPQQETYNDLLRASEGDRERPRQNHFSRANKLARMGFVGGELVAGAGAGPGKQGSIGGQGQQQQQQPRSHGHRLGGGLKSLMQTLKGR